MRDTIDMAREAGLIKTVDCCGVPDKFCGQDEWKGNLKAFEALVRADEREARSMRWDELIAKAVEAEREACAKVCEQSAQNYYPSIPEASGACTHLATAIRARKDK
jgi:hypothetical protein